MVWLQVVAVVGPIAGVVIGWWLSDRSDLGRLQREFTLQRVKTREDFLVEVLIEVEAQVVALLRLTESLRVEDRAQLDLQWRTLYATRHLRTGDAMRQGAHQYRTTDGFRCRASGIRGPQYGDRGCDPSAPTGGKDQADQSEG